MIGDSKTIVGCICGHGDDGRHTIGEFLNIRVVGCPYAPPDAAYLINPHYIYGSVVIDNIGGTMGAGEKEKR